MQQNGSSEPPRRGDRIAVVVLAAGQGTRMRSSLSKLLHPVAGLPLVRHVVDLGRSLDPVATAVVVGHAAEQVAPAVGEGARIVHQAERLGTGHAVLQARDALRGHGDLVVVLYGDTVLLLRETLERMIDAASRAPVVLLTAEIGPDADPTVVEGTRSYGRIKREGGRVVGIVELPGSDPAYDASRELNSGVMVFRADWLWENVAGLPRNANGEYFLTDLPARAIAQGHAVEAVAPTELVEMLGVNTQEQLATVNRIALDRIRRRLMDSGVRLTDPASVFIDAGVAVEPDAVIEPNTHLRGATRIGAGTVVGPNSIVEATVVGRRCRVVASVLEHALVGDDVTIGPFAHLRPGARVEDRVELGNYAEVKASTIGAGTRMHHFSYVGDAELGPDTNVGAGTITCNFDGERKHRTVVGAGAFIGSDTMLVAPVTLGDGARTGAGSVVTKDVAPGQLVVGVPARPIRRTARSGGGAEATPAEAGGASGRDAPGRRRRGRPARRRGLTASDRPRGERWASTIPGSGPSS
jgi:bifunctional UDP-N-acetylglucosamine pyrophosphorylase / glucosamine-1-phosphate N-acetyltransferase